MKRYLKSSGHFECNRIVSGLPWNKVKWRKQSTKTQTIRKKCHVYHYNIFVYVYGWICYIDARVDCRPLWIPINFHFRLYKQVHISRLVFRYNVFLYSPFDYWKYWLLVYSRWFDLKFRNELDVIVACGWLICGNQAKLTFWRNEFVELIDLILWILWILNKF